MGLLTKFLKLYKPAKNEIYDIDKHLNPNFDKIDGKLQDLHFGKINKSGDTQVGILQFKERCTDVNAPGQIGLGGLTSTGYVHINANTNGANADSPVTITSGQGITGTADKGLAVGKDYLKWLGGAVWHAGNFNPRSYEPKINKKTGFNLNKSDSIYADDTNTLATCKAVNTVYDYAKTKEPAFTKRTGFNLNLGLVKGAVLEGHRLAESLGVNNYGGYLNQIGQKLEGNAYYDNNTSKMYLCVKNNTYTSANVGCYEPLDNNTLLDRTRDCYKVLINSNTRAVLTYPLDMYDYLYIRIYDPDLPSTNKFLTAKIDCNLLSQVGLDKTTTVIINTAEVKVVGVRDGSNVILKLIGETEYFNKVVGYKRGKK